MAKFQDSSGVACCLDWNRKDKRIETNANLTPVKAVYYKDTKKYSSCDLYDSTLNNFQTKDFAIYKAKSFVDLDKNKVPSTLCLVKQPCTKNISANNSSSYENMNSYYCNKSNAKKYFDNCCEPSRGRAKSPCSIWSGKFTSSTSKSNMYNRNLSKTSRRDREIIPAMKERCFNSGPRVSINIKPSQTSRSRNNNIELINQRRNYSESKYKPKESSKLNTVNSYTLIKQNYKKHNQEYYKALDKVSNFYSECTTENDICNNLLKYLTDRCGKYGKKNACKQNSYNSKSKYNSMPYDEKDHCYEKEKNFSDCDDSQNNGNFLETSENRFYKDAKLNEMFINEQKKNKQNNKKSIDQTGCLCKNIKLCDIICHRCQQKLIKYNNGNCSN
jgi:hypothetical protein